MRKLINVIIVGLILLFALPLRTKVSAIDSDSEVSDLPLTDDKCNRTLLNVTRFDNGTTVFYYDNGTLKSLEFTVSEGIGINEGAQSLSTATYFPPPTSPEKPDPLDIIKEMEKRRIAIIDSSIIKRILDMIESGIRPRPKPWIDMPYSYSEIQISSLFKVITMMILIGVSVCVNREKRETLTFKQSSSIETLSERRIT